MGGFSTMVDMSRDQEEIKEDLPPPAGKEGGPLYPYGLCISLSEDELEKLGLDGELPQVGMMIHLSAMAKVTSVSQNEREQIDGTKTLCKRVELQITHLATENEDEEDKEMRHKAWYGGEEKAA
jgi:Major coat protein-like